MAQKKQLIERQKLKMQDRRAWILEVMGEMGQAYFRK